MTIKQAAQLAGVSTSVVQDWLTGASPHDLHSVARLGEKLGVSFKSLLLGEPEQGVAVTSLAEAYEEIELFSGICRVSIQRLEPRGRAGA